MLLFYVTTCIFREQNRLHIHLHWETKMYRFKRGVHCTVVAWSQVTSSFSKQPQDFTTFVTTTLIFSSSFNPKLGSFPLPPILYIPYRIKHSIVSSHFSSKHRNPHDCIFSHFNCLNFVLHIFHFISTLRRTETSSIEEGQTHRKRRRRCAVQRYTVRAFVIPPTLRSSPHLYFFLCTVSPFWNVFKYINSKHVE